MALSGALPPLTELSECEELAQAASQLVAELGSEPRPVGVRPCSQPGVLMSLRHHRDTSVLLGFWSPATQSFITLQMTLCEPIQILSSLGCIEYEL